MKGVALVSLCVNSRTYQPFQQLRPHLRAALHLVLITLPKSFLRVISNRMACGMAILLRASYSKLETHSDWTLMGDTMDMLAHYGSSRVFVFDGIASTVEYALLDEELDEPEGGEESPPEDRCERPVLSEEGCKALSRILIRYALGFYQNDLSLCVPAMLCLEKVYRNNVELLQSSKEGESSGDIRTLAPDLEFWQNISVAIYSVCRSPDQEISNQGAKAYRRVVIRTAVDQIPDDKWVDVLFLMVNKQPPLSADVSRGNTFSLLGQLIAHVLPHLTHNEELRDDLVDLTQQVASLAQENFRHGRRGSVSPLFEKTLQAVTYLSNHMTSDEWAGESVFSNWASDTLLAELERVGAAGAVHQNQKAVAKSDSVSSVPTESTTSASDPEPTAAAVAAESSS